MFRQRSYVFINVIGLATGLACSILIALFVLHELNYDRFNEHANEICMMVLKGKMGATEMEGAWTCSPLGPTMITSLPEVLNAVRIEKWGETVIKYQDKSFVEDGIMFADSTFFDIFSIPLIIGDRKTALSAPWRLVLTQTAAKKYFGNENPIGKMLKVTTDTVLYSVTGVMEDVPESSHFAFNILGSLVTNDRANDGFWVSNWCNTYVLLDKNVNQEKLQEKINTMVMENVGPQIEQILGASLDEFIKAGNSYGYFLTPLLSVHLNSNIEHPHKPSSDVRYIYIFSLIALLILVIAGINYMNLSTARSAGRSKEVGIRKVVGSTKKSLVTQFLFESFVLTFISLILGIMIVELLISVFNNLIHLNLQVNYLEWYTIPGLIVLGIIMGFLSGTYPAFFLASFRPVAVLTGSLKMGTRSNILRSILVVFQMTVSIVIILGTISVFNQIHFMIDKDLGFTKENLLVLRRVQALGDRQQTFIDEVEKLTGVFNVTHSTATPGHTNNNNGYWIEGEPSENTYLMQTFWVDDQFAETYEMGIAEGRFFSDDLASDSSACLINQSAVNQFGLKAPYDFRFKMPIDQQGGFAFLNVIGVIEDFHYQSLHDRIFPAILIIKDESTRWGYISIRIAEESKNQTVSQIEKLWKEFSDNDPMLSFFMDENFDSLYQEDRRTGVLSLVFSILAILIASLGLFGLASFTAEQRTREIGIRKVNGASASTIILLLSKEIIILVGISTLISWPVGYFMMKGWLQNFYFRIPWSLGPYLLSLGIVLAVAWLSVSYQAFKASRTNPAEALRYE